jgi:hypothetical protein
VNKWDEAGDAVRSVIRAYHGSPYDFDRFDASKLGTGEGNQAYGHGLYFAGEEDVARRYRDALKTGVDRPVPRDLQNAYIEASIARSDFANRRGGWLRKNPRIQFPQQAEMDANETLFYDLQNRVNAAAYNPGRMYEVEIAHPENALLDYDRPMGSAIASRLTPSLRAGLERGVRERLEMGQLKRHAGNLQQMLDDPSMAPGQLLLHGAADDYGAASAARMLRDAGVPGLRYLDQGSRRTGDGTHNYVVFPGAEDSIRILRKYAIPGAVGTGAAAMQEQ